MAQVHTADPVAGQGTTNLEVIPILFFPVGPLMMPPLSLFLSTAALGLPPRPFNVTASTAYQSRSPLQLRRSNHCLGKIRIVDKLNLAQRKFLSSQF